MKIIATDYGFVEYLDNPNIEKIIFYYNMSSVVYYHDKSKKNIDITCSSFNRQYGIPVSSDGTKLFLGSWEKGVYAYSIQSGEMLWRFRSSRIRNIIVYPDYVVVLRANKEICKVNINTGVLCDTIKSGTLEHIFDLGFPFIYAETLSGRHTVIDVEKMVAVKKYTPKIINPHDCLSLVISGVSLQNNTIVISGTEAYPKKSTKLATTLGEVIFSREIDSNFDG